MKAAFSRGAVVMLAALLFVPACARVENEGATSNAAVTTPRTPDGKPDVSGVWTTAGAGGTGGQVANVTDRGVESAFFTRTGGLYALEIDGHIMGKGNRNKPMYRPEYWEKVRYLQANMLKEDPSWRCLPDGVPRMGPPQEIRRQGNRIVFLYSIGGIGAGNPNPFYRVIRLDRPHDRVNQQTSRGDSVGHWEGDTLVVDTVGFGDETWLTGRLGYFHSVDLRVVERFTHTGNEMKYEVIVEDPTVLLEPWVWEPRTLMLDPNPEAMLPEDLPCSDRDAAYIYLNY